MAGRENIWRRGGSSWKATCKNPQHLRHFEQLSLEVSSYIFRVEKANGVSYELGVGGVVGNSLKKHFGLAATSLDSEVQTWAERSGLCAATFLESSFKKELFPGLCYAAGGLCSALPHTRTEPEGWGMEHGGRGWGADKPGKFSTIPGDRSSQRGRPAHHLLALHSPVMICASVPSFPR